MEREQVPPPKKGSNSVNNLAYVLGELHFRTRRHSGVPVHAPGIESADNERNTPPGVPVREPGDERDGRQLL